MVQRVSGFDASRRLADHHREFALVVHESGVGWAPGVAAVADQRARAFEEDQGLVLGADRELLGQLLDMVGVIQA